MRVISISRVLERITNAHPRTRKAQLNIFLGLVIKGAGMLISLLLVPMTIDYLSKEVYGTWLTISSIIGIVVFFDVGIGNGLRNKLSEAISKEDVGLARSYISTAYLIFGLLQLCIIAVFVSTFHYIPWQKIFNTSIESTQIAQVVLITSIAIAVKLVIDIVSYVLFAIQESGIVSLISLLSNILVLAGTYQLTLISESDLLYLGIITAVSPILVSLVASIILYSGKLKIYKPSWKLADFKYAKGLLSLGYKFFVIQMTVIVIFYSDNLVITQLFGPSEVTDYNVAYRYFNVINTIFAIVITPYWSAFTEAYMKKDIEWMKKTYSYLQQIWIGFVIIILLMIIVAQPIYHLWIGDRVHIPTITNICMGLFVIISCWNNVTVSVINGTGKVKLQLYFSIITAVVNIPLAIFLGKMLNLGSAGVILATSLALLFGSVLGGIQAKRLVLDRATGIWNK